MILILRCVCVCGGMDIKHPAGRSNWGLVPSASRDPRSKIDGDVRVNKNGGWTEWIHLPKFHAGQFQHQVEWWSRPSHFAKIDKSFCFCFFVFEFYPGVFVYSFPHNWNAGSNRERVTRLFNTFPLFFFVRNCATLHGARQTLWNPCTAFPPHIVVDGADEKCFGCWGFFLLYYPILRAPKL